MIELDRALSKARAWACYDCGKCTATCPLTRAGAALSPRRHVLSATAGGEWPQAAEDGLFACLTCGACEDRCPAEVGYGAIVQQLRERAREHEIEPDCPHGGALQSAMRMMARGGMRQDRLGWLEDGMKTEREKGKVFYWTGCTPYLDAFFPELGVETLAASRAAVRLLNALSLSPVVSPEERCCGHDLLWNGDRASFEKLARHNVALVAESGAELLVVSCAECLRTWRLDYAPFMPGGGPRIVHISELIAERLAELPLRADGARRVTYQDPCRLGRHLGLYEPPREALAGVPGVEIVEMRHSRRAAVCCAGGSWSHCDRFSKKVQVDRLREARGSGAETLVTACPKCQIHFRCAMKDPNLGGEIEIEMRDVAQIVAEALEVRA